MTYSYTQTTTFTITHARHLVAKVATDLKRMQRFYGSPSDDDIDDFATEAISLVKDGYLGTVAYGFRRSGSWIVPTVMYSARDLMGNSAEDDDPGRIRPRADTSGAAFSSHLTYSDKWWTLSPADRASYEERLPFKRTTAAEPSVSGHFVRDLTYSAGGRALDRASVRSY